MGDLYATQKEIKTEKVESMRGEPWLAQKPIIVSLDDYILDGHHRWAALLADDPHYLMRTVRIGLPIRELLLVARKFPGAERRDFDGKKVASTFKQTARTVFWRAILSS